MWRLFGATAALFVFGVYAGFVLPVPNTISTVQGESTHTYPYLSAVSYTQLPTANSVPTVAASIIENPSALDARFAGMLLHVRWLLERRGGTAVETELNRLDKQILSVMDDVSDDIGDLREDIDEAGGLPSGFVIDNTGTVTAGVWQGTPVLDAYINDILTIGTGSSFANDVVTPNSLLSSGQVDEYCLTYEGTGTTFEWEMCGGGTGLTASDIDTSSELSAILGDETGTGSLVFSASPTFTGTVNAAATTLSSTLTMSGSAANIALGSNYLSGDGGDEGIFVASDGKVGIGTTTPSSLLSVVGNGNPSFTRAYIYGNLHAQEHHRASFTSLNGGDYSNGYTNQDIYTSINFTGSLGEAFGIRSETEVSLSDSGNYSYSASVLGNMTYSGTQNADLLTIDGLRGVVENRSGYQLFDARGMAGSVINRNSGSTVNNATGVWSSIFNSSVSGTITNAYGINTAITNQSTITNTYGLYIGDITSGTQTNQPYSVYASDAGARNYFAGNVGIGTSTPNQLLTVQGNINLSSATGALYFDDIKYLYASSTNDSVTFGENAGATFTSGTTNNVALGFEAGRFASNPAADDSIYIGNQAGYNNAGWSNIFLGRAAGYNGVGYSSFFVGDHAGYNSAGNDNVFIGQSAGENNLGESGVFIGSSAGANNTGLFNNNFFGYSAGYENSGDENNFFGQNAGYSNDGDGVNAFGELAGYNNSGSYNNFFGRNAGYSNTGNFNEMIGYQTGQNLRSTSTVAVGAEALFGSAGTYSSLNNVALGYRAGYSSAAGSGNNILVGYQAADNLTTGNNNIIIGYAIDNVTASTDNALNIGNLIFGNGLDGTGTTLSSGKIGIGTTTPSAKLTVQNTGSGNSFVVEDQANDSTPFVIGPDGKVGIGVDPAPYISKFIVSDTKTITSGAAIGASADITANPSANSTAGFSAAYNFAYSQAGNVFNIGSLVGIGSGVEHYGSGVLSGAYGLDGYITNGSAGTITTASALRLAAFNDNASGIITTLKGIDIYDLSNTGTIGSTYGLYIGDLTDGTQTNAPYALYSTDAGARSYFAGNVGIGTTSPYARLSVTGTSAFTSTANFLGDTNTTGITFLGGNSYISGTGTFRVISASVSQPAYSFENDTNTGWYNPSDGAIRFSSNNADVFSIISGGSVGIGTTTPAQKLQVFGNIRIGTAGGNGCLEDFAGTLISGTCSSDEDLKENIEPITREGRSYLEALAALTPVTYTWNQTAGDLYSKDTTFENLGLIAQEVESQFPELVSYNDEGYRQVNFSAFPFYIIEALKEVWQKIQGHDERIERLEEENEYLKNRIENIESEINVDTPQPSPQPEPEVTTEPESAPELPAETSTEAVL